MNILKAFKIFLILAVCTSLVCGCRSTAEVKGNSVSSGAALTSEYFSSVISEKPVSSIGEESSVPSSSSEIISQSSRPSSVASVPSKPAVTVQNPKPTPPPQVAESNKTEMRAVWISFLEYQKILKNKTEKAFTKSVEEYFNKCVNYGLNTVVVQVRSHGDAYYNSKYFPASVNFTGERKNKFPFDPLKIMVAKAHERGLKIEAWVNPYRGSNINWKFAESDPVKAWINTDKVFKYADYYYFNPADKEVQQLIINGIIEIIENYSVDGIHFDDYFYPTTDAEIDAKSFEALGGGRTLEQFRRDNVNELILAVYKTIKAKKNITFGISPAGNIDNCVDKNYADVRLWGSTEGYVDYLAPQIYWDYGQMPLPFETALENWNNTVTNPKVKLIVGLAPYRIENPSFNFSHSGDILKRQVTDSRKAQNYGGFIMFRCELFFRDAIKTELDNLKSIL